MSKNPLVEYTYPSVDPVEWLNQHREPSSNVAFNTLIFSLLFYLVIAFIFKTFTKKK